MSGFVNGIRFFVEKVLRNLDKGTAILYYFNGQKPENLGEIHYK